MQMSVKLFNAGLRALPSEIIERKGAADLLLLVVHRRVFDLLAFRIGSAYGESAALAIGGYHDLPTENHLAIFLVGQLGRMRIHRFVGPHIRSRIAGEGIIFPIEFSRPLVVGGLAVAIDAIHCNFYAVTCNLIGNCVVLYRPRGNFRLGLV